MSPTLAELLAKAGVTLPSVSAAAPDGKAGAKSSLQAARGTVAILGDLGHHYTAVIEFRPEWYRRKAWDIGFPELRLLVEFDGGFWAGVGHGRPEQAKRDARLRNLAGLNGWSLLTFSPRDGKKGTAAVEIAKWIEARKEASPCA